MLPAIFAIGCRENGMWKATKILEGDYGCEERMPGEPKNVIVYLADESGNEIQKLVDDDWRYENDIVPGSNWEYEV